MYNTVIDNISLQLETSKTLFSPNAPDKGTLAMLSKVSFSPEDKVLDLGCGCGIAGIFAAKYVGGKNVFMCDIDTEAVTIAKRNAALNGVPEVTVTEGDGLDAIPYETGFTLILCNPPYHADFAVAKRFIEKGYRRLASGGKMLMVTKRRDWYKNKFISVFGGVRIDEADGYFIFRGEKRANN